jgi:hypothetical protein
LSKPSWLPGRSSQPSPPSPPPCATSWRLSQLDELVEQLSAGSELADRIAITEQGRGTEERANRLATVVDECWVIAMDLRAAVAGPRGGAVMPSPQPPGEP